MYIAKAKGADERASCVCIEYEKPSQHPGQNANKVKLKKIYASVKNGGVDQEFEFICFPHLILCENITTSVFQAIYRYEGAYAYCVAQLMAHGFNFKKQETLPLLIEKSEFNDLQFTQYSLGRQELTVFNGLAVTGGAGGLDVVEDPAFQYNFPPQAGQLARHGITALSAADQWLQCNIPHHPMRNLALQIEELQHRLLDEDDAFPCELGRYMERIMDIQLYCDSISRYSLLVDTLAYLKDYAQEGHMQDASRELEHIADQLGLDLSLFNQNGNQKIYNRCCKSSPEQLCW